MVVTPLSGAQMVLNEKRLAEAANSVALIDKDLARILAVHGTPPLWARKPGFITLLRIILEQQVSLASADAMYRRLTANIEPLTPGTVLAAGTPFLRSFGITRQKATYFLNLAEAIQNDELDLEGLGKQSDESAIAMLTCVKGIGPWTAKIYLLMALRRPDVWPVGDIALATAVKNLKGWPQRPTQPALTEIAKAWRPYRATAARMLWHYYLREKMNKPVISDNKPQKVTLSKDKKYYFCTCGRSKSQPFCDGSHRGTTFSPKEFTVEKDGDSWLCACKHTGNAPFCDGAHKQFSAESVGKEGPGNVES